MNSIPVISLHDYRTKGLSGVDCDALAHACKDHGFFIVGQHGGDCLLYTSPSPRDE